MCQLLTIDIVLSWILSKTTSVCARFSKDLDVLDTNIPQFTQNMLMSIAPLLSTFVIIVYSTPVFIAIVVPLHVFFVFLQVCPLLLSLSLINYLLTEVRFLF